MKKYIAVLLTFLLLLPVMTVLPMQASASADLIANLSTYKQYFRRTIGSFARADMVESDILASVTVAQAIVESGWGQSSKTDLPEVGKNLFGIRTYSGWGGNIYDAENNVICSSLEEFGIIDGTDYMGWGWRAYESWADSVADHSDLLNTSGYAGIPGMTDYKAMCYALVDCNYTKDIGYIESLIAAVENYDLTTFDDITANEQGVIALKMNESEKVLSLDGSGTLTAEIITTTTVTQPLVWASDNTTVATVDQNGLVTAQAPGVTLVTATIGNREACCIVTVSGTAVSYNATVNSYVKIRQSADTSATELGRFSVGTKINVTGPAINLTTSLPKGWYPVTGISEAGTAVTGYSSAECITLLNAPTQTNIVKVGLSRFEINRDVGKTYQFVYAVGSTYPIDKTLSWSSSDPSVASVDTNGLVTMLRYGTAIITATATGGANASCVVNVTTAQVKYIAHAVTTVYVRADDTASSKSLGFFDSKNTTKQDIIITDNYYNADGLINDAWFYAEGVMKSGVAGIGYSNSTYIVVSARLTDVVPVIDFTFSDTVFALKDGYLFGAGLGCTVGELLSHVSNTDLVVYDKNGVALTSESTLTSGCTLNIRSGGVISNSVTIIIKGDINCDGNINASDYLYVKRYLLGTINLDDIGLRAAYVSGGNDISVVDYIMIKRQYLGTYTIVQNPTV